MRTTNCKYFRFAYFLVFTRADVLTHTDKYFNNNGLIIYTIFARL